MRATFDGFKRRKLDGIRFATEGWQLRESESDRMLWTDESGTVLSIDRVGGPDDMPPPEDRSAVRRYSREIAEGAGGAIVSVDAVEIAARPSIRLVYKRRDGTGYAYTGMVVMHPFVLAVAARETGFTGLREATVCPLLLEAGEIDIDAVDSEGRLKGWFFDPYDAEYPGIVLCSLTDDPKYDSLVPNHPLTKVRETLNAVTTSITFDR